MFCVFVGPNLWEIAAFLKIYHGEAMRNVYSFGGRFFSDLFIGRESLVKMHVIYVKEQKMLPMLIFG